MESDGQAEEVEETKEAEAEGAESSPPVFDVQSVYPLGMKRFDVANFAKVDAQFTVPNGGGTKKEFPQNLLSAGQEGWNKWLQVSSN